MAVSPPVLLTLEVWGAWGSVLLMCQNPQLLQPPHHLHLQLFRLECFSNFLINGEALHPTGLCLIRFRVTIFSLGPILPGSIDLQDVHIPIVKHHRHFLHFVWHNVPYQWKVLPFGLATAPRAFTSLTKPILFLCHHKGLLIIIH